MRLGTIVTVATAAVAFAALLVAVASGGSPSNVITSPYTEGDVGRYTSLPLDEGDDDEAANLVLLGLQ